MFPNLSQSLPVYSEDRPECPQQAWHTPEFDTFKVTLHILPDTPGGSQWPKYILLMLRAIHNGAENDNQVIREKYLEAITV